MSGLRIEDVQVWGVTEIGVRTGWSRQWASTMTRTQGFPAARWKLAAGHFWWADDVEAWILANRPELADGPPVDEP